MNLSHNIKLAVSEYKIGLIKEHREVVLVLRTSVAFMLVPVTDTTLHICRN
jgi:hypothetical protein